MPRLETGAYDVVVASMVLEHLPNPFEVVREVARVLKPGGQFLFATVVRDALDAKLYGRYWAGFDLPRHMVWLTKADIGELLAGSFERAEWFHHDAAIDFVRSASWRRRGLADRVVIALGERWLRPAALLLALLGLTCRVSVRCVRTGQRGQGGPT